MIVVKRPEEIKKMRRAGQVAAMALRRTMDAVHPGVNLLELARIAEDAIREEGATPSFKGNGGFPASLCLSVNDEVVHGIPHDRTLVPGDIVSIDVGAYLDGYHGDTAATAPVGEIAPEVRELLEVTQKALEAGVSEARIGGRLGDISAAVQQVAEAHGYGVVRELVGHGIGRAVWEDPQVPNFGSPGRGVRLQEGMTICIEPMINLGTKDIDVDDDGWTVRTRDGRPSAHFEHTVAVGATPDILTVV